MDFRALRYFVAVYEELSLSGAAKRCLVAQPSISTAIQHLESELERQLFVRHSKGVSPTRAGTMFYPYATKALSEIHKMQNLFKEGDSAPKVPIKLALMPFLSGTYISLIIKELLNSVQGLDLSVVDWNKPADARIISSSMVKKSEAFQKLWQDEYVLVMPKGHQLTTRNSINLKDISGLPFVSRTFCDALDAWNFAIQINSIELNTKATVSTEEYALDLVAAGLGISLVPSHSTSHRADIVIRKITDTKLERIVGLAYNMEHPLPFQLLTAIDKARDCIKRKSTL
jgi:LysR family transcriptional regulator, benzoate and cis,cis-muconate-responsive activator of ben and cat genes